MIKQCGGVAIVQRPDAAEFPSMPVNAIQNVPVDHVLGVEEIPDVLVRMVHEIGRTGAREAGGAIPDGPHEPEPDTMEKLREPIEPDGPPSGFTCPECGGALWDDEEGIVPRFRCRVGHAYTAESLLSGQSEALETALWSALRALEEVVSLRRRMAARARSAGFVETAEALEKQMEEAKDRASAIRTLLLRPDEPQGETMPGTRRVV